MERKVITKEFVGIQPVYSTNVEETGNYVSDGDIINKNCVIDQDYQGQVHINLINSCITNTYIKPGEKIVQFVAYFQPIMYASKEYASKEELYKNVESIRGEGGFGSTGV